MDLRLWCQGTEGAVPCLPPGRSSSLFTPYPAQHTPEVPVLLICPVCHQLTRRTRRGRRTGISPSTFLWCGTTSICQAPPPAPSQGSVPESVPGDVFSPAFVQGHNQGYPTPCCRITGPAVPRPRAGSLRLMRTDLHSIVCHGFTSHSSFHFSDPWVTTCWNLLPPGFRQSYRRGWKYRMTTQRPPRLSSS